MWTNDILGGLQVTTIKTRNWGILNCVKVCKDFANALKFVHLAKNALFK